MGAQATLERPALSSDGQYMRSCRVTASRNASSGVAEVGASTFCFPGVACQVPYAVLMHRSTMSCHPTLVLIVILAMSCQTRWHAPHWMPQPLELTSNVCIKIRPSGTSTARVSAASIRLRAESRCVSIRPGKEDFSWHYQFARCLRRLKLPIRALERNTDVAGVRSVNVASRRATLMCVEQQAIWPLRQLGHVTELRIYYYRGN